MSFSQPMMTFDKAFKGKYAALAEKIDTSHGLWNQLLDRDVLSSQQISTCQSVLTEDERVSKMLDLLRKRDNSLFPNFCEALVATGQQHVVDYLLSEIDHSSRSMTGPQTSFAAGPQAPVAVQPPPMPRLEVPIHGSFRNAFRNVRSMLVDRFDVSHGLIDLLWLHGVLTDAHVSDIRACRTEMDRANKLMELLDRRDNAMFPRFCEALYQTGQMSIVEDVLRPNLAAAGDGAGIHAAVMPAAAAAVPVAAQQPAAADTGHSRHVNPPLVIQRPKTELPEDINIIKYTCLRNLVSLAEGGFGVVYSAEHEDWGTVAYKELKTSIIKPESRLAKDLIHEAQMHKLRHPNIIMLLAVIFEPQHYGVLFEYVTYGALDSFYKDYEVQWPMKLQISQGVIRGMNYLHTKNPPVVHGDLKVQNVLIGDDYEAKICDFGLAKWRLYSTTKTNSRSQRGTFTHIPPENWRDINAPRTVKFDIYSFGIMLWELLTQDVAFAGAPAGQIQAAVINGQRADLLQLEGADNFKEFARTCIEKCWNGEPDQRPTFGELNGHFHEMLTTNKAAVDEAKRNLDEQTSRWKSTGDPMDSTSLLRD